MSYAVVRVQKMSAGGVRGIQIHDRREKSESHTNPDIDRTRTEQNYDLCPDYHPDFYRAVKERIEQLDLKRAVRKDAVVMAQVLVTSDSVFFEGKDPQPFFKAAYDFLEERYGKENVISATVHMDEKTPHMHFNFVPVTEDGRLSAKSILTRESLTEQQTAFHEQVGQHFGLQRGERRDSGKRRVHFETAEYKGYVSALHEAEEKAVEATERAQDIKDCLIAVNAEFEAKKAFIREADRVSKVSVSYPPEAKVTEKGFKNKQKFVTVPAEMWESKHISANEKSILKKSYDFLDKKIEEFQGTAAAKRLEEFPQKIKDLNAKTNLLEFRCRELESKCERLQSEKEKEKKEREKDREKMINRVNAVLQKLPVEVADWFVDEWEMERKKEKEQAEKEQAEKAAKERAMEREKQQKRQQESPRNKGRDRSRGGFER